MEEKTAVEELKEFANKTNREIDFDDKTYVASGINPRNLVKQHVIISGTTNDEPYFVSYCDMLAIGDNAMYSGFFFPIEFPLSTLIQVRQKNILDKVNPFFKKSEFTTQSKKFDSKVIIVENDERSSGKLFYSQGTQSLLLDIFKLDPRLKFCVNHIDVGIVSELKNKSTLGIYITEQWLLDEAIIKKLYALVGKLKMKIQIGHEVHS
ncbi:hypothetical protein DWB61_17155 [Ancylomarina euxinus]|uniref:Uncharacterized protein n=1 Tax=Ancylomarina euxinus TaxID=2283627 RepID=A0A425XWM6_9BACT|nr:hypothetical protein [Ancylomarina euxinus]MCZ4696389.1 hypothetical protein [Ancylomarina euxinus]MUP16458.1 hypothetical protein [Ancylomarina euxinus]RRG19040.1 hypothetical protein DWB61_17155 [Ancylomarina euxinus]